MANRKLPFGYETRRGKVCVQKREADLVREIFRAYAEGASYQELTHRLNIQVVPYNEADKPWNKNMVARILNCKVYTGTELYPAIMSEEDRHQAEVAKPSASTMNGTSKTIRQLARCDKCGSTLALSGNRYGWARWNCPACGALTVEAATPVIVDELVNILSALLRNPDAVQTPPQRQADFAKLETELDQLIYSENLDESAAKAKAVDLAIAQFNAIGSEDYETMRIQHRLAETEWNGGLDTDLLRQITSFILIHPNGAVSLKLKNGQIMEGS